MNNKKPQPIAETIVGCIIGIVIIRIIQDTIRLEYFHFVAISCIIGAVSVLISMSIGALIREFLDR